MRYTVELDLTEVKKYASDVQRKYVPAAAGIALKRVGNTTRNVAAVTIRERLAIKASVAKGAIKVQRIGMGMTLWIYARGKPIPLREYQARQTRKGVSYRVARSLDRKTYRTKHSAGWISHTLGGHVFARVEPDPPGKRRGRIKKIFGPSVPQYFITRVVIGAMERTASARWPVEFAAALRGVLIRRTGVDVGATLSGLG